MIGFVVPNQKQLTALAEQKGIRGSWEEICNHAEMEKEALRIITDAAVTGLSTEGKHLSPFFYEPEFELNWPQLIWMLNWIGGKIL